MVQKIVYVPVLVTLFSYLLVQVSYKFTLKHPYADLNVEELITKYEYPVQVHHVTTEDGYILTLQRIPHGRKSGPPQNGPVLLVPGLLQSAWDFVHYGPNHSLPFLLTEKGYDVWLGNVRGTTWSRKHKTLDPDKDAAYWNYTIEEIAIHDLPTIIDYILETTRRNSLHYVGFSQGTSAFFMMGSLRSEYLSKIKLMTAFGPAVFMKNPRSPIVKFIANNWRTGEILYSFFKRHELFGRSDPVVWYLKYICNDENSFLMNLCIHHFFIFAGDNYDELDKSMVPLTTSNYPCGASLRQIVHMYQMINSGNFCKYDFGSRNLEVYGQEYPPHYDLSKVKVPVALYYSSNDWIVDTPNIDRLIQSLPNVVKSYKVPLEKFSHSDFLYAKNVANLLYNIVIDDISKY
ncbi:hypothetical protein Zmor_015623 [Zophobas morio]|uniref:Lipase n=1 Tax=Zophobas morio TaxID=2755281 RepID=A0AA38IH04_9CUCU|nr:hypothetical protein Zmor_015623 [Zophobas morio]